MLPELDEVVRRRKTIGLTQTRLAKLAGVSRSLIAKLETRRLTPSYRVGKAIFDVLEEAERRDSDALRAVAVGQIHAAPVEFVEISEKVQDVWVRMLETAYSQLPIKDGDKIIGAVTEKGINHALMERDPNEVRDAPVEEVMQPPFPTVNLDTPVAAVIPLLQHAQAVLTVNGSNVIGIVSNSDVGKIFRIIED